MDRINQNQPIIIGLPFPIKNAGTFKYNQSGPWNTPGIPPDLGPIKVKGLFFTISSINRKSLAISV